MEEENPQKNFKDVRITKDNRNEFLSVQPIWFRQIMRMKTQGNKKYYGDDMDV